MNCFQIVRNVLDELYQEIPDSPFETRDEQIKAAQKYFRDKYGNLRDHDTPVDYSNPVHRFTYVYSYVTCHANLVYTKMAQSPTLQGLFTRERFTASCLGGGPGSDLLGILKYMMTNNLNTVVSCNLLDKEECWGESWSDIGDKIDSGFTIRTNFQRLNVTDQSNWVKFRKLYQSDLFTLNYFMSELHHHQSEANPFFEQLLTNAKPGSLFLYIDNNNPNFYNWFDRLVEHSSLKVLERQEGDQNLPYDEQKDSLGEYYNRFGSPKLSAKIAYRLCVKE